MQMGPKEIAVEYRTAVNKQKQIKVLAELNQCAERKIAEILAEEGEELPKKYQEILQKPARRSWKYPEGEPKAAPAEKAEPEPVEVAAVTAEPEPDAPAAPATDRDLFDAVATLLPKAERQRPGENGVPVAPRNEDEARHWVDGVGPVFDSDHHRYMVRVSFSPEDLLRAACRMLTSALDLEPEQFHVYSCGVLDLVHALTEEV